MNIIKKYTSINLVVRIAIGLLVGVILGILMYNLKFSLNDASSSDPLNILWAVLDTLFNVLGNVFIGAMRSLAPILIFFLITSSLMKSKKASGGTIKRQVMLFITGTICASICAIIINWFLAPSLALPNDVDKSGFSATSSMSEMIVNIFNNLIANPVDAIANGNFLGILFWSVFFGIVARKFASKGVVDFFSSVCDIVNNIVKIVIEIAPFGVCGLIYMSLVNNGVEIYLNYAQLLLVFLLCIAVVFFVVNPLLVFFVLRRNPYPLVFRVIKEVGFSAFFLRSSAANLPMNIQFCKRLGLDKDNYQVAIPLGLSMNMEGAAVTIVTLTLACCRMLGIEVEIGPAIILALLTVISALGSAGVAGGSILLVPMACSLFGIGSDIAAGVVAVGFIIGVIQDSVETALNSSTDGLFTATIQLYEKIKADKPVHKVVGGTLDDAE